MRLYSEIGRKRGIKGDREGRREGREVKNWRGRASGTRHGLE